MGMRPATGIAGACGGAEEPGPNLAWIRPQEAFRERGSVQPPTPAELACPIVCPQPDPATSDSQQGFRSSWSLCQIHASLHPSPLPGSFQFKY